MIWYRICSNVSFIMNANESINEDRLLSQSDLNS